MKLIPSFFKIPWKWPQIFKHHKTLPFQAKDNKSKKVNSVLSNNTAEFATILDSSQCFPTVSGDSTNNGGESVLEMPFKALKSERLFFEPGNTSSIFAAVGIPFKECVVLAIESEDPYLDFRVSMEEMVEAYGVKDWECLEELLSWYLKMNRKNNHGFIVGAFVDMFLGLPSSSSHSFFSYAGASTSSSMGKGGSEVEQESIWSCRE